MTPTLGRRLANSVGIAGLLVSVTLIICAWRVCQKPRLSSGDLPSSGASDAVATRTRVPEAGGVPLRLQIPSLSIDAPIIAVTSEASGALAVPDDVRLVGWWSGGATPGANEGTVVLDGHVDSRTRGTGALFPLRHIRIGASLDLVESHMKVRYRVVALREYAKDQLPSELFRVDGPPHLSIITCGGAFNYKTRHYEDNVVAYAVAAPNSLRS